MRACTQLWPTLCHPMDCRPPDSSVHGIFQARMLEWVAISFCRESSRPRDQTLVSFTASMNIRKFTVHMLLKPGLENFEHYFTSV